MICLYSGTPGSGKSLHVAGNIKARLWLGKPVICNFALDTSRVKHPEQYHYISNQELEPSALIQFSRDYFSGRKVREEEIWLVLDEAQLLFNARAWQAVSSAGWVSFFSQHRKYGYHVVLVAQFDRMIDRQIRSLIEYEYIHRKVSNYGWFGKIFSAVAAGKLFVAVQMWYPIGERVGSEFFVARKSLYSIYNTYADFGGVVTHADKVRKIG